MNKEIEKRIHEFAEQMYQAGYEDGKAHVLTVQRQMLNKQFNEGYEQGLSVNYEEATKKSYVKGLEDAWEVARKIVLSDVAGGIPIDDILKIYSTSYYGVMKNIPVQEAVAKLEEWEKRQEQEQSKKRCENCNHYCGYDNKFKCDIKSVLCIEHDRWTPKQDAPDIRFGSIENRDKIVKALAGLLAAYGEQLWDVVADMEKNS